MKAIDLIDKIINDIPMNDRESLVLYFSFNKIREYGESLDPIERAKYLKYVEKEYRLLPDFDDTVEHQLLNDLKIEIEYVESIIELNKKNILPESKSFTKIQWLGTQRQLVFLFEELSKNGLIPKNFLEVEGKGLKIISEIFLSSKNGYLKNTSLANAKSQLSYVTSEKGLEKLNVISKIVNELKEY